MFCCINAVANEDAFPSLSIIRLGSLFVWDVDKYKATENSNVCKALSPSCPGLFEDQFSMVPAHSRKSILKIVGRFHCFSPEVVGQAAVNK